MGQTYNFGADFGQRVIITTKHDNIISFGRGILASDVTLSVAAYPDWTRFDSLGYPVSLGLVVSTSSGDELRFLSHRSSDPGVEEDLGIVDVGVLKFADGTTIDPGAGLTLQNGYGTQSADTFLGTSVNDLFVGMAGDDEYMFGRFSGHDTLGASVYSNNDGRGYNSFDPGDAIVFESGITAADVRIRLVDDFYAEHLVVRVGGSTLTIRDFTREREVTFSYADGTSETLSSNILVLNDGAFDTLAGTGDTDYVRSRSSSDVLMGGAGVDVYHFSGAFGDDTISDQSGYWNDIRTRIVFDEGINRDDVVYSTEGRDALLTVGADSILVKDGNWLVTDRIFSMRFSDGSVSPIGVGRVAGTDGDDDLSGTNGFDAIGGYAGNDHLTSHGGRDTLSGGLGDDILDLRGQADANVVKGGGGSDHLYAATVDTFTDWVEHDVLYGGMGNDVLEGGAAVFSILHGGAGRDTIYGGGGQARGEDGSDVIFAQYGNGGNGADLLSAVGPSRLAGSAGNDRITGSDERDYLSGGRGADSLDGSLGDDMLVGNTGSDFIRGGEGNDTLSGAGGDRSKARWFDSGDTLDGGSGDDILRGGYESYGQTMADVFRFTGAFGHDRILDFQTWNGDQIDLSSFRDVNGGVPLSVADLLFTEGEYGSITVTFDLDRDGSTDSIDLDDDGALDAASIALRPSDPSALIFIF